MAKKKSFIIRKSLAQAFDDTVSAAENYSGKLHVDVIPLRKIELDPNNPRDLVLSFHDLHNGLSHDDPFYRRKINEKEALKTIANSIKEQGIINPIIVYKYGELYRLIAGERRTLASILAGKEDIQAKIIESKPSQLKTGMLQWIENIEREDLTLWERICNLEKILQAYTEEHHQKYDQITATNLKDLIGCSLQQASNYFTVIKSSAQLRDLIKTDKIRNLEKAVFIEKAPAEIKDQLITACLEGITLKGLKSLLNDNFSKKKQNQIIHDRRGRQMTQINFGITKDIKVAKIIIESIIGHSLFEDEKAKSFRNTFKNVQWDNYKSVTNIFKELVKTIEKAEISRGK